jgi:hypothetical protein
MVESTVEPVVDPLLRERKWEAVAARFEEEPLSYVVIDELLPEPLCEELHQKLLAHWGWRHKDWNSTHLRNTRLSSLDLVPALGQEILGALPGVFDGYELSDYWALLYPSGGAGRPHFDAAGLNMTYWLTPDRFNRRPGEGGLVLYSSPGDWQPQAVEAAKGLGSETPPEPDVPKVEIPHRRNRAVLFRATTLHRTANVDFAEDDARGHRMNLTFSFDRPDVPHQHAE